MVRLKQLSVRDHVEDSAALLAQAHSAETSSVRHCRTQSGDFILDQRKNYALSIILLLTCYSALLLPAYLSYHQQAPWSETSTEENTLLSNRSASLLVKPCSEGRTATKLRAVSSFRGLLEIPVFLHNGSGAWKNPPPLGLQGSEETLVRTLTALPQHGRPVPVRRCSRCVVVASGGILHGKRLGAHIDKYDLIIRMNNAPVLGFEEDVGSRTTIRLVYPEGAPFSLHEYQNTDLVALVAFKRLDLEWLSSVVTKQPLSWWSKLWFWRNVVTEIPLQPEKFRILNPEILNRTLHVLLNYTNRQRKTVPTLGISAVVLALQLCDELSLAGFGYDMTRPGAPLHYYETLRMDTMSAQVVHDIGAEGSFLRDVVRAGIAHDLTGAL